MRASLRTTLLCLAAAAGALRAESSEYPLALNLPTGDMMQFWDLGVAFTHRFGTPVRNHSRDLYGLDGYAYPAFGLIAGIKPVKGLNLIAYRTADNKTLVLALQQRIVNGSVIRMSLRAERFDETVEKAVTPVGTVGISGASAQLPIEVFIGESVVLSLVPTWISRTTSQEKAVFTGGAGLRWDATAKLGFLAEFYPRPSRIGKDFLPGFAAGVTYKTFKHRFTLLGTNVMGTTANQVLSGDYGGGPREKRDWGLGFNITRTY